MNADGSDERLMRENTQIINTNLARLDRHTAELVEMREAFLQEKVRAVLKEFHDENTENFFTRVIRAEDFPEYFRELTEREVPDVIWENDPETPASPEEPLVKRLFSALNLMERISVCRRLAHMCDDQYRLHGVSPEDSRRQIIIDLVREDYREDEETVQESDFRLPHPSEERIAYLRNTYTDAAYVRFRNVFPRSTALYYSDFQGVCEALYYGRASACILPLENSTDGKLVRFYSLIHKYDLRIAMTVEINAEDGDVTTKYALLRKNITVPEQDENSDLFSLYFECTVILEEDVSLSDILFAASIYGLSLTRADADPLSYAEAEASYDLIFRIGDGDLQAMLSFLYLMVPQFTLLGIYPMIAASPELSEE